MPPPKTLRIRCIRYTVSLVPATAEPIGAPSPFEKQIDAVSKYRVYSSGFFPVATHAFINRAPSRCIFRPASSATARISAIGSTRQQAPPPRLCVFSMTTRLVRGAWQSSGRIAERTSSAEHIPHLPERSFIEQPESMAGPPPS